ncbi:SGNH/GDSL hydrolase family protein [Limosilactobacillus fermentum]|uniref:SGNH/GDSL hydrolase family protein n=1 Tax=Limosilactobacillus fermentum TaxID=1613 RepID=UPI00186B8EDA|nr:SGNH/GDSL hydrolase family protein [Limosilactobacillus fermentum]MBE4710346.1 SGNH/GDSL hydrolase family protein [Limosilactobacillus fermentum]
MADQELFMQNMLTELTTSQRFTEGNAPAFSPDRVNYDPASPLNGRRVAFLGSSITYGLFAKGVSFVDYLQAKDGLVATKAAVSGTTLAGTDVNGYLKRMKRRFNGQKAYDLFVCQLSTNDTRHGATLGERTGNEQREGFDLSTTLGAIEEICAYVKQTLDCPVLFYTCVNQKDDGTYAQLVDELKLLQAKWDFAILDLFNDAGLNATTAARPNAMYDEVHPTQAGYLKLWLPVFEQKLGALLG